MESSRHEQTINVLKKRLDDKEDAHTSAIEAMESSHKETINALEKRLADERNAHSSTQSRLSADLRRLIAYQLENHRLSARLRGMDMKHEVEETLLSSSEDRVSKTSLCNMLPRSRAATLARLLTVKQLPQGSWNLKRDGAVASIKVDDGDTGFQIWNASWGNITDESTLQSHSVAIADLLNRHGTSRLYWDFSIGGHATLAELKPDGHARVKSDLAFQTSPPHQAVYFELKTHDTFTSQGLGHVLEYCHRLLTVDTLRTHVFAVVTDYTQCQLVRVNKSFVKEAAAQFVDDGTVTVATFPWYDAVNDDPIGLRVLYSLGQLEEDQLGLGQMHLFQQPVELFHNLGAESSADVYLIKHEDGGDAVLKVANSFSGGLDMEAYVLEDFHRALSIDDGTSELEAPTKPELVGALEVGLDDPRSVREMLKHIPHNLGRLDVGPLQHLQFRPIATPALFLNLKRQHVEEFVALLQGLHRRGWFHCNISHHSIMLADHNWQVTLPGRESSLDLLTSEPQTVILLDWGSATKKNSEALNYARPGTQFTASQRTLAQIVRKLPVHVDPQFEAQQEMAYLYTEADELESAVKALLVILSPTLLRSIKQQMAAVDLRRDMRSARGGALYVLWECWQALLPAEVFALCEAHDYKGVAAWLLSKERLLLFEYDESSYSFW